CGTGSTRFLRCFISSTRLCAPGLLGRPARKPFSPSWSPLPGTTPHQPLPNLQMSTDHKSADGKTQRGMESMDRFETRTIPDLTQTGGPDPDSGVAFHKRTTGD